MNEGSIKRTLILSGADSIAAFEDNGAIYRLEPYAVVQEISLFNLVKDKTRIFRLSDRLTKDYEIVGITAEIPMTLEEQNGTVTDPGKFQTVDTSIRLYSPQKTASEINILITPYPFYVNKLFINHRDTWHVKCNRDVQSVTFMCKPIYLEQPVVFP